MPSRLPHLALKSPPMMIDGLCFFLCVSIILSIVSFIYCSGLSRLCFCAVSHCATRDHSDPSRCPLTGQYVNSVRSVVVGRWKVSVTTVASDASSFCVFDRYSFSVFSYDNYLSSYFDY